MSHRKILESQLAEVNRELELSTFLNKGVLQSNSEFKLRIAELEQENAVLRTAESRLAKMEDKLEAAERKIKELTRELKESQRARDAETAAATRAREVRDGEVDRLRAEATEWRMIGERVGRVMLGIRERFAGDKGRDLPLSRDTGYTKSGDQDDWPSEPGYSTRSQDLRRTPGRVTPGRTLTGQTSAGRQIPFNTTTPPRTNNTGTAGPSRPVAPNSVVKSSPVVPPLSGHIRKRPRRIVESNEESGSEEADEDGGLEDDAVHENELLSPSSKFRSPKLRSNRQPISQTSARPRRAAAQAGQAAQAAQAQLLAQTTSSGTKRRDRPKDHDRDNNHRLPVTHHTTANNRRVDGKYHPPHPRSDDEQQDEQEVDFRVKIEDESPRRSMADSDDDPLLMMD